MLVKNLQSTLGPATKTAIAIAGPTDLIIYSLTCIVLMSNLYDLIGRNKDYFTYYQTQCHEIVDPFLSNRKLFPDG